VENFAKVVCPALHMLLYSSKVERLSCMLAVHVISLAIFIRYPPFREFSVATLAIAFKVATVFAYVCSLCAETLSDDVAQYSGAAWHIGVVTWALMVIPLFRYFSAKEERMELQRVRDMCALEGCKQSSRNVINVW